MAAGLASRAASALAGSYRVEGFLHASSVPAWCQRRHCTRRSQNGPDPIERRAGCLSFVGEDAVHSAERHTKSCIAAQFQGLANFWPSHDGPQAGHGSVVGQIVGRRQVGPEEILNISQGLLDNAIVLLFCSQNTLHKAGAVQLRGKARLPENSQKNNGARPMVGRRISEATPDRYFAASRRTRRL